MVTKSLCLLQADRGHWQALRVLTETAAYVDVQDAAGRSVLYLAAQKGYACCIEVVLAQGASCLLNDNRLMWTPIHVAGMLTLMVNVVLGIDSASLSEISRYFIVSIFYCLTSLTFVVSYQLLTDTQTACA